MTLTITRGLPGSGKTTTAKAWVEQEPLVRARVNRDDLRANLYGRTTGLTYAQEQTITVAQRAAVRALLTSGQSVIVDDTNLRLRHARAWADLAIETGHELLVIDLATDIDECVRRDAARDRVVGEDVIRRMAAKFRFPLPPVVPTERVTAGPAPYVPDDDLPRVWLVDIDGTLAHMGDRSPYDWAAVLGDNADEVVVELVNLLAREDSIVVMSGRDEACRADTLTWLDWFLSFHPDELLMRPAGDTRADHIVKAELFDQHVRGRWNVVGVLDDRDQVVRMWRGMGLKVLQVAEGAF